MSLHNALRDKLLDVRLRDKLVAEGKLTKEEVRNYLSSLSDETGNYTHLPTGQANGEDKHSKEAVNNGPDMSPLS